MRAAVDVHCHILPGLDDGAAELDDAVAMARQGHQDGIEAICATPHIRADHDVLIAELPERREELQRAVRAAGLPVTILPGGEVAGDEVERLSDVELRALALGGGGRWDLLEPEPGPLDDRLTRAAQALLGRGFKPLIAHPERHSGADLHDRLRMLIASGALVQVTAALFLDARTSAPMLDLARDGLVHVLGSDSHSAAAGRPVALNAALGAVAEVRAVRPHLEWLAVTAPAAIVNGEDLTPPF